MKALVVILFVMMGICSYAQELKSPSSFFPSKKTKVLVVGTFHFAYPGLDVIKTKDEDRIDVLIEPKKSEVTELVEYIKKFNPTKIAIEAKPDWKATQKLRNYKKGKYQNEKDERFQLAIRIARDTHLDTIYSIDSSTFSEDLAIKDSVFINELFKDFDFNSSDPFNEMVINWLEYEEMLQKSMSLLEYHKRMNSREYHQADYGNYLVGDFKLSGTRGADILSIWWYNRNLRIFSQLRDIDRTPDDRILIIFGNSHAALLRQLLECSPEFDFVEFDKL